MRPQPLSCELVRWVKGYGATTVAWRLFKNKFSKFYEISRNKLRNCEQVFKTQELFIAFFDHGTLLANTQLPFLIIFYQTFAFLQHLILGHLDFS
jgi:hypothetical protein